VSGWLKTAKRGLHWLEGLIPPRLFRPKRLQCAYVKVTLAALLGVLGCSADAAAANTIWASTAVPAVADVGADSAVELGVSFKSDVNGYITGIRFYKSAANTGTHVGNLWSSTGTLLASATFTGETASGWQQVNFANPVAVTANTVYVASYHSTIGHWSADWNFFASSGVDNPPLHALANVSGTPDGRFTYASGSAFPTSSNTANYWVDVAFTPASTPPPSGNASTIWPSTAAPAVADVGADSGVELGVSFKSDVNGYITGVRFYKSSANTGTHVGNLWSSTGTLLASSTFTNETASGWQQVNFSSPVAVTANTVYVASYHSTIGHWSADWNFFASSGVDNAPLHALANTSGMPDGRYTYGSSSAFPSSTNTANYWVDVAFTGNSGGAVAPSITGQPVNQTVATGQTATFSVTASGTAPLAYQWKKNGTAISGATASSYTTPATSSSDNGAAFTVVVSNASGSATSNAASLTVNAASSTLQITTSSLPGATLSGAYNATLAASGGTTPYSWSLSSGSLPTGLSLSSSGSLTGTPSILGSFPFTVQVKDAAAHTASSNFSINVVNPVASVRITSPANGATVSSTVNVSGTASDTVSVSSVQLSVDNGGYSNASGTTSWSYSLNTASLSNGSHTLTAKTIDLAGLSATSSPVSITVSNGSTATDCTLFASPSGNDGNSGTSASAPKTFNGAASASQPGSVVCLLAGPYNMGSTFYPPTSGTPSSWIVYKSYGNGAVNLVWTAGATGQPMFKFGNGSFPSGAAYLEFRGLNLDGQNNALDGFLCQGGHHLRFMSNNINNTGGSGVGAVDCDYLTSDHNMINHNGYLYGWTSAISYNSAQWFDNYAGFHNIASNNIITGEYDGSPNHTDGNGIILDLSNGSYNFSSANTPPALIINNVVYGNGGRCIQANVVTNFYIINNTCYKNNLDTSLGNVGSFTSQNSMNGYFINNIAVAVASNNPSYDQESSNSNIQYFADMYFGSSNNFSYSNPSQLINANPLFTNAPGLSIGGYTSALAPSLLGTGLTLQASSPACNRGIDPSTLSGLAASIVSDLKKYIYVDINGKARPQGGGSDLGAYQH
jgi:Domain of unknown function (DUF4082)/Bacterial Ig domain/Putative Ig domain/Immunoglobulin domain